MSPGTNEKSVNKLRPIKNSHKNTLLIAISSVFIVISSVLAYLYVKPLLAEEPSKPDITYVTSGKVTEKTGSCSKERLLDDGTIRRSTSICDGGGSIVVGDVRISTSGGSRSATEEYPYYVTDIFSINPGDEVEVRYIKDAMEFPSEVIHYNTVNCKTCYIKVKGATEPLPQRVIDRPD